ncbi:ABC transporter permease [Salinarimonas soli]|uniref:ABC transporter permease n=1 Tax=Salinarimonas soli TaxID=1638099 RepID=A0A5B2VC37_9HYPH|nr:ABC transporter permease [Salinarimonas soli]KAA2236306.1 ABC transporter permease [Salinarimonas soli]
MFGYVIKRAFQMVLVLWAVSVLVFVMMSFTGDPTYMMVPLDATEEQIAQARRLLGLDHSHLTQYRLFLKNVLQGDFGRSFVFRQPANSLILERLPATLEIVFLAMAIALVVAIPLGVYAGANPKRAGSHAVMAGSLVGISLPGFWVGMVLIFVFAVKLQLFPSSGRGPTQEVFGIRVSFLTWEGLRHIILPAVTLSIGTLAILMRIIRAEMMEVMRQDFVRFARAKGVGQRGVLFRHGLKNALIPLVTVFGLMLGDLIAFATLTETIFAWPGIGKLLVDSIYRGDRPVIVVYLMFVALMFVVVNFAVDVLYALIDPRIKIR